MPIPCCTGRLRPLLTCGLVLSGCSLPPGPSASPPASLEADLVRRLEAEPADPEALRMLVAARLHRGNVAEALRMLDAAETPSRAPIFTLLRAAAADARGRAVEAHGLYRRYLEAEPRTPFGSEARGRLIRLEEDVLATQAARLLDADSARADPDTRRALVIPLQGDPEEDLRALAATMTRFVRGDLSATERLQAIPGAQTDVALDRIAPGPAALGDADAVRLGRLVGAGWIVRGRLDREGPGHIRLRGSVLSSVPDEPAPVAFDLEAAWDSAAALGSRMANVVYTVAGHDLAPYEARRLGEGQGSSTDAWIAYGRGRLALEEERYADAYAHFETASRSDGEFDLAREAADRARLAHEAPTPGELAWLAAQVATQHGHVQAVTAAGPGMAPPWLTELGSRERSTLIELLAEDRLGGLAVEVVVIVGGGGP